MQIFFDYFNLIYKNKKRIMIIKKYYEFINNNISMDLNIQKIIENIEIDFPNESNLDKIWDHPSYNKIIQNGKKSIKYLIEKLDTPSCVFWFKALESITNMSFSGKPKEKKELWKDWFKNE